MRGREIEYELVSRKETEKGIVEVYRPILTEEERAFRMSMLMKASEDILREKMRVEKMRAERSRAECQ